MCVVCGGHRVGSVVLGECLVIPWKVSLLSEVNWGQVCVHSEVFFCGKWNEFSKKNPSTLYPFFLKKNVINWVGVTLGKTSIQYAFFHLTILHVYGSCIVSSSAII